MSQVLSGRSALVTGASRGIGRAVVEKMRDEGARVFGLARTAEALDDLAAITGAETIVADVSDDASLWAALDDLQEMLGGAPNIVVNAAGVFDIQACDGESVAGFDRQVAVNLRGPFLVTRFVLPAMLKRGSGLIVNVGSIAGRKAFPGNAAYSASKFGLRGLHEVLCEELRGTGVRASLVEPSATDTPIWDPLDPDRDPDLPDRAHMLRPDDVAEAVVYLATRPDSVAIPVLAIERS